jgi:hypothetical protein
MSSKNQKTNGFAAIAILIIVFVVLAIVLVGWRALTGKSKSASSNSVVSKPTNSSPSPTPQAGKLIVTVLLRRVLNILLIGRSPNMED